MKVDIRMAQNMKSEKQGVITQLDTQRYVTLYLCLILFAYESIGQRYRDGVT